LPDHQLIVTTRDDDTTFGILHSRFHEAWAIGLCTWLGAGNDPRYTPSSTFETFPFPEGLTPDIPAAEYANDPRAVAIAEAARRLNELREVWLNPPDLVDPVPEVVPGFPDRLLPKSPAVKPANLFPFAVFSTGLAGADAVAALASIHLRYWRGAAECSSADSHPP
jgi:hypothetical protein